MTDNERAALLLDKLAGLAGIDLVSGNHDPRSAEAARFLGLELLAFHNWPGSALGVFLITQAGVVADEQRDLSRLRRVYEATQAAGVTHTGDLPHPWLAEVFDCDVDQVPAILATEVPDRWWWHPAC